MLDTVIGLPVHILLVHLVVVALPTVALAAVLVAARGPWRRRWTLLLAVAAFGTSVMVWVAAESGEALYQRLAMPPAAREHTELGESVYWFALALTGALLVLGLLSRRERAGRAMVTLGTVLVFVTAGLLAWRVVQVGHTGSAAVWSEIVQNTQAPAG